MVTTEPGVLFVYLANCSRFGAFCNCSGSYINCVLLFDRAFALTQLSAYNNRHNSCTTDKPHFVRSHVAAYFVSLLLCDFLQGIVN
jgi:hypothetical protein